MEVFLLLGRGFTGKDIAQSFGISLKTVDAHRTNIRQKLGLRRGKEVTRRAVEWVTQRVG